MDSIKDNPYIRGFLRKEAELVKPVDRVPEDIHRGRHAPDLDNALEKSKLHQINSEFMPQPKEVVKLKK